jgi:anti-sigma-K factor RskA
VLKPIDAVTMDPQRALELWAVPGQGAPRSLGVVAAQGTTTVIRAELLRNTAAFAVSVEPAGGSPTGAPTGPIISVGKLES